jgi:hypothetical protein
LPFVDQHRLGEAPERGVRIRPNRSGLGWSIKADDRGRMA